MDESEADYIRQQLQELRQTNRRWKILAIFLGVLALLLLVGGASLLIGGFSSGTKESVSFPWASPRNRDVELKYRSP
jgi:hypothetical protein